MKLEAKPYFLQNRIQHYDWGARNENAFIPKFLSIDVETDRPYAELWIGAHPNAPSDTIVDDKFVPLDQFIKRDPEAVLGRYVNRKYNGILPFLLKVLSAGEALSIQLHPDKAQAAELHRRHPEHYPDDNHKPEIAVALDHLQALAGFRSVEEISLVLHRYPEINALFERETIQKLMQSRDTAFTDQQLLIKKLMKELIRIALKNEDILDRSLGQLETRLKKKQSECNERDRLFLDLRQKYGVDIGLIFIFLLNLVNLSRGQALFLSAGRPHAYLRGNIIECMANSDNVIRAGLTLKYKDLKTMQKIADCTPGSGQRYSDNFKNQEFTYETPADEFQLTRITLSDSQSKQVKTSGCIQVLLVTEGLIEIEWQESREAVAKGKALLIPASLDQYILSGKEQSFIYNVTVRNDQRY